MVRRDTREDVENRSICAQESCSTRLYRSRRKLRVTSIDTQAAMRLAIILHAAAPKAKAAIIPPHRQIAGRSRAGTHKLL